MAESDKNRTMSVIMFVFLVFLGLVLIKNCGRSNGRIPAARNSPAAEIPRIDYSLRVCDDAWEHEVDRKDDRVSNFIVELRPGCFSGYVYPPRTWREWHHAFVGDPSRCWVAMWFEREQPRGPYIGLQFPVSFGATASNNFRLQGGLIDPSRGGTCRLRVYNPYNASESQ